jgi:hypothetical protein
MPSISYKGSALLFVEVNAGLQHIKKPADAQKNHGTYQEKERVLFQGLDGFG